MISYIISLNLFIGFCLKRGGEGVGVGANEERGMARGAY